MLSEVSPIRNGSNGINPKHGFISNPENLHALLEGLFYCMIISTIR
jgi:hypothetical protein